MKRLRKGVGKIVAFWHYRGLARFVLLMALLAILSVPIWDANAAYLCNNDGDCSRFGSGCEASSSAQAQGYTGYCGTYVGSPPGFFTACFTNSDCQAGFCRDGLCTISVPELSDYAAAAFVGLVLLIGWRARRYPR